MKLWRGLTAVMALLLTVAVTATSLTFQYPYMLNDPLGIETAEIISNGKGEIYYESEFGEINEANQELLIEATKQQTITEEEEGAVLLRNENQALPLKQNERSITIFGQAIVNPVYKCSSSGNIPKESQEKITTVRAAFDMAGFQVNPTLITAYENSEVQRVVSTGVDTADIGEDPISFYTKDLKKSWEKEYNDAAIIFLSRESGEGTDYLMTDKEGISQLALHKNEKDLIEMVTSYRDQGVFGKVIVLLNTTAPMDCDWLEDYGIDACLWIGTPGQWGAEGITNLLTGKANPSGHLIDTYASNSLSAPATVNSGTQTPKYANADEMGVDNTYVNVQVEGIYTGYKYYETRYEDCILNQGNAASSAGASYGAARWDYAAEMVYPFGYGLSYTEFEQNLKNVAYNAESDTFEVTVSVKNTGSVEGKSVVQLYAQTPYGKYEKENLIEKSAIQLVGFDKTELLKPGQTEEVTLTVDRYLLASYDYIGVKGYILSQGDYYLAIGSDCHDALNNVLAAKGATGLIDSAGNEVPGDSQKVYHFDESQMDTDTYKMSSEGVEVTNRFDDADINYWVENTATYLSRQDWAGTYPVEQTVPEATDEMVRILEDGLYKTPEDAVSARDIPQGVNADIMLLDMKDEPYDSEKWDTYLSQLTIDELASQLPCSFETAAITSVIKNVTKMGDGMDGTGGTLPFGDKPTNCCYAATVVLGSTWSPDVIRRRGELIGEEALYSGMSMLYSGGCNLHRTPFGARNFEYYSEDGTFTYYAAMYEVEGTATKGVNMAVKHLAVNDQCTAQSLLSTFFTEQAMREQTLRAFEGAIRVAKTKALMQSYNRVGLYWSSANKALLTDVIAGEWGFKGCMITDAASALYKNYAVDCVVAGTDAFCIDGSQASASAVKKVIEQNDDGNLLLALRQAVKDNHYAHVHSCAINGTSKDAYVRIITPWWQTAEIAVDVVLALGMIVCAFLWIVKKNHLLFAKRRDEQ